MAAQWVWLNAPSMRLLYGAEPAAYSFAQTLPAAQQPPCNPLNLFGGKGVTEQQATSE